MSHTSIPTAGRGSTPSVLIIGAGFGGIAAAIELRRAGFTDLTILEAADGIGGTWLRNTYPGAACDVPSQNYSYSFAQRDDWPSVCSPQPEILAYMRKVAADFGVADLVRARSPVASCDWDAAAQHWTATTTDGRSFTAAVLIVATGQLGQPQTPDLPGLERFAGDAFHSARWDHGVSLAGKRVAVVGSGASAVQFVPEIAQVVGHLDVFQRTGNWFINRQNRPYGRIQRTLNRRIPALGRLRRAVIFQYLENITRSIRHPRTVGLGLRTQSWLFMRWQLRGDPELRAKVWPGYTFGCKRVLFTSKFLPALRRPNVELVADAITEVRPEGVVTSGGTLHPADVIIWATGFRTLDFMLPMQITGAAGATLEERWVGGAHAHLGITVPGFPSLFLMYGPNTNTSGGSILVFLEAQAAYIRQALELLRARRAGAIEVREDVERRSDAELQSRFAGTAWLACTSWYRADGGRIVTNWPGYMRDYLASTEVLDPAEFTLAAAPAAHDGAPATK